VSPSGVRVGVDVVLRAPIKPRIRVDATLRVWLGYQPSIPVEPLNGPVTVEVIQPP
jgi:hypothetical protein